MFNDISCIVASQGEIHKPLADGADTMQLADQVILKSSVFCNTLAYRRVDAKEKLKTDSQPDSRHPSKRIGNEQAKLMKNVPMPSSRQKTARHLAPDHSFIEA